MFIADLQAVFGEERKTTFHCFKRISQIGLTDLFCLMSRRKLRAGAAKRVERLFEVARTLPHLGLKGYGRLEQGISRARDLMSALGTVDECLDDPGLFLDLDLHRIIRIDQNGDTLLGRKNATPTKVWLT